MEKVTIIIPAYNAEQSLRRCFSSAVQQSYKNIEILVINDASTDDTETICHEYAQTYKYFKYVTTQHQGVSAARNKGIELATGDWIFFMDADDNLYDFGIDILINRCGEQEWVIGNYTMVNKLNSSKSETHFQYFSEEIHYGDKSELPQLCLSRNFNCVWAKLYRRDIICKNDLHFDETQDYGEDLLFNLRYFQYVHRFVIMKEAVYNYCYQFGKGLGTRFLPNEWELQKNFITYMEKMCRDVYRLSECQCTQMNAFYYAQTIATLQRIADEHTLSFKEKRTRIKKITGSKFFSQILTKEYKARRIKGLDYLLLKRNLGLSYHYIHRGYVKLKNVMYKGWGTLQ